MEQPCLWENDVYVDLMWSIFLASVATFEISIEIYNAILIETSLDCWSQISSTELPQRSWSGTRCDDDILILRCLAEYKERNNTESLTSQQSLVRKTMNEK